MNLKRFLIVLTVLAVPTLALAADHAVTGCCPLAAFGWCPFC